MILAQSYYQESKLTIRSISSEYFVPGHFISLFNTPSKTSILIQSFSQHRQNKIKPYTPRTRLDGGVFKRPG